MLSTGLLSCLRCCFCTPEYRFVVDAAVKYFTSTVVSFVLSAYRQRSILSGRNLEPNFKLVRY